MTDPSSVVIGFVLEKLDGESLRRRAELYRALAQLVSKNEEKARLLRLAADCNSIEIAHAQAKFDFEQRNRRT